MNKKSITLQQPMATLVAMGIATIKVTNRLPRYFGEVAIHAGSCDQLYSPHGEYIPNILREFGYRDIADSYPEQFDDYFKDDFNDGLPYSSIVGICEIISCTRISSLDFELSEIEYRLFDLNPRNQIWRFSNAKPVTPKLYGRGNLGVWDMR